MAISKKLAAFLNSACARGDDARAHLTHPFVAVVDGVRWFVATDGHRMHAVRASKGFDHIEPGWVAVSEFGAVYSIAGKLANPPAAAAAWSGGGKLVPVDRGHLDQLATVRCGLYVAFDTKMRPRVHASWQDRAETDVAVNPALLAEALAHLRPVDPETVCVDYVEGIHVTAPAEEGDEFVRMSRGGSRDPITVEEDQDEPSWRAVIMPVQL